MTFRRNVQALPVAARADVEEFSDTTSGVSVPEVLGTFFSTDAR